MPNGVDGRFRRFIPIKNRERNSNRPALDELMVDCRRRNIDVVLVWKFNRFARSLRQLIVALDELEVGDPLRLLLTESWIPPYPAGSSYFKIFGAIGQFECSLISERTKAGLQHARREGKRLGRPPLKELSLAEIRQLRGETDERAVLASRRWRIDTVRRFGRHSSYANRRLR